ncbi:MAG: MAPEG family protein [Lysobacterales bacterium]
MNLHIAIITLLNVLLMFVAALLVGRARGTYQIKAPAVSGQVDFERVFRAQQNTLEQTLMFLPTLWLAAQYGHAGYVAALGYVWLLGRTWYLFAYARDAARRGGGFMVGMLAWLGLTILCLIGIGQQLLD